MKRPLPGKGIPPWKKQTPKAGTNSFTSGKERTSAPSRSGNFLRNSSREPFPFTRRSAARRKQRRILWNRMRNSPGFFLFTAGNSMHALKAAMPISAIIFFKSVGSISNGEIGGVHGKTYAGRDNRFENKRYFTDQNTNKNRIAFGEVIAELGEDENNTNGKLRLAFKETWAIFQKYRNMR